MMVKPTVTRPDRKFLHPFSCKYCSLAFSDLSSYQKHTTRHKKKFSRVTSFHPIRAPERLIPVLSFETDRYEVDISVVSIEDPKQTNQYEVSRSTRLPKKSSKKNSSKIYTCKYCDRTYQRRHQLWGHIRVHAEMGFKEKKIKALQCRYCFKHFAYKCDLSKHESGHRTEHRFQCPHCNSLFSRQAELDKHINVNMQRVKYICGVCKQSYVSKCKLQLHAKAGHDIKNHTVPENCKGHLKCPVCLTPFFSSDSLLYHITKTHVKVGYKHKCKFCHNAFKKRKHLREHKMKMHRNDDPNPVKFRPLSCPLCRKTVFATVTLLANHLTNVHILSKTLNDDNIGDFLKCEYCHKLFKKRKYLAEHMKRMHKVKLECDKSSKHYSFNEGDECHRCSMCPAVYTTKKAVTDHVRRKHRNTGLKQPKEEPNDGAKDNIKEPVHGIEELNIMKDSVMNHRKRKHGTMHDTGEPTGKPKGEDTKHTLKKDNYIRIIKDKDIVDDKSQSFQCLRCPRAFSQEKNLKQHIQQSHSEINKGLKRAVRSPSKRTSARIAEAPKGTQTFKCGYCLLPFADRRLLSRHMVRIHTGDEI
ncbi:uncharacterized protein [Amphiura filiformis]|uniref:uncharacterized protein n=1 Tax=Amphiura filiformis TaxID=82378 RepID=UPI003B213283